MNICSHVVFLFFKQKTAYEMRISDWSSDVCSSDLAKGAGAYGTFTVTHDITKYTRAKLFSEIGKKTPMFARFSTVAGERGAADAERDIRGIAMKFYHEDGNWDLVGNNNPRSEERRRGKEWVSTCRNRR